MLDHFSAALEAVSPERDCYRAYRIEAGTDLLGDWLVEITFGRIGRAGHMVRYCVSGETAARKLVKAILTKRASAKRRIGVEYRYRKLNDSKGWLNLNATPKKVVIREICQSLP